MAAFLADEPHYTEATWIAAYAACWSQRRPDDTPQQVLQAAREAFAREGTWNNPKIAAGCDALYGPRSQPDELRWVAGDHAETERRHIAEIVQRIAFGKQRVAKMRLLIAKAARHGQDTTQAEKLLAQMRHSVALLSQLRDIASSLLDQMENAARAAAKRVIGRQRGNSPIRSEWVADFSSELRRLRPRMTLRAAWTLGLAHYGDGRGNPVIAAHRCHDELGTSPPVAADRSDRGG